MISTKYNIADYHLNNTKEVLNEIRNRSILYVKGIFKSRFTHKNEILKLKEIQNYINTKYNTKYNIRNLIIDILLNLYIDINNKLYIQSFFSEKISAEELVSTIKYGVLGTPRSNILDDAIIFALNTMRLF